MLPSSGYSGEWSIGIIAYYFTDFLQTMQPSQGARNAASTLPILAHTLQISTNYNIITTRRQKYGNSTRTMERMNNHTNTRTHEHTNTRTHEHTNTRTHEHTNTRTQCCQTDGQRRFKALVNSNNILCR